MATKADLNSNEQAQAFGRYIVCGTLGEGAMGRVYLADDPVLERKIALKVITVDNRLDGKTQAEYRNRFTVEAKASAKLNHQSIVTVYDAGDQDGLPWIAFQYVDGESLEKVLEREGKVPLDVSIKIILDIASALQHAHSFNIYHRDIKPANIIIDNKTGIAKLTDFGIAKAPWIELTQEGKTLGTPGYMSPEQINGFELDACTDLFSLGVIAYRMISGKHPFMRDTLSNTVYATLGGEYTPISQLDQKLPVSLDSIIAQCLRVNKQDRVQSAESFITLMKTTFEANQEATKSMDVISQKSTPLSKKMLKPIKNGSQSVASGLKRIKWYDVFTRVKTITQGTWHFIVKSIQIFVKVVTFCVRKLIVFLRFMLKLNRRRKIIYSITATIILLIFTTFWSLSFLNSTKSEKSSALVRNEKKKTSKKPALLDIFLPKEVKECRAKIEDKDFRGAEEIAANMIETGSKPAFGYILLGELQIHQGNYSKAKINFEHALKEPRGKGTIRRELSSILPRIGKRLTRGKAPHSLITLAAVTLKAAKTSIVKDWVGDQQYWRRWNAVYIMETANVPVDMVPVYILDLKYAGSSRTRARAAKKLGEIGDKRAIPALQDAKSKGLRDLFVSLTASTVLENNF